MGWADELKQQKNRTFIVKHLQFMLAAQNLKTLLLSLQGVGEIKSVKWMQNAE